MLLEVAARVGPYEILSALGAGGMGEVYRAHDTKLGREVAIKILPDTVAHDQERLARFELRSCENNSHDKMCGLWPLVVVRLR